MKICEAKICLWSKENMDLGGSFLISRSVDGPGCWESWVGGRKQKTKNRGGAGAQPSEPVPVEEKNQILTMEFHELDSKPKSRE